MCIEFVIQVLKQKNAHVSFPVGMVTIWEHLQGLKCLNRFVMVLLLFCRREEGLMLKIRETKGDAVGCKIWNRKSSPGHRVRFFWEAQQRKSVRLGKPEILGEEFLLWSFATENLVAHSSPLHRFNFRNFFRALFAKHFWRLCRTIFRRNSSPQVFTECPGRKSSPRVLGRTFYQTYARITGNQGFAQIFLGPFLALNTGK